jgi:hypothetical protein
MGEQITGQPDLAGVIHAEAKGAMLAKLVTSGGRE